MAREITVYVTGGLTKKSGKSAGVQGEGNVTLLNIEFDGTWQGYAKRIVWRDASGESPVAVILGYDKLRNPADSLLSYSVLIPPEPLAKAGWCSFVLEGCLEGEPNRVAITAVDRLEVLPGAYGQPAEPTAAQALQIQGEIEKILGNVARDAQDAQSAADDAAVWGQRAESAGLAAQESMARAIEAQSSATQSEAITRTYWEESVTSAASATQAELMAKSWAVGEGGIRPGEQTDNAKHYALSIAGDKDSAQQAAASAQSAAQRAESAADKTAVDAYGLHEAEESARTSAETARISAEIALREAAKVTEAAGGDYVTPSQLSGGVEAGVAAHDENAGAHGVLFAQAALALAQSGQAGAAALAAHIGAADAHQGLFGGKADLIGGKVPLSQLPNMDYDPAGSAQAVGLALEAHSGDSALHITAADRVEWNGKASASHTHPASAVTAGAFGAAVTANTTAAASLGTAQVRSISAGTADLTAGSSALATGTIYLVYEG